MKIKFLPSILLFGALAVAVPLTGGEGTGNPFAQAKFVPDISLILDSSFVIRDLEDPWFSDLFLPGFSHAGPGVRALELDEANVGKGFNLNYAELSLASVVDPYFDLFAVFHLSPEGFEIEEAYFSTRRLPAGLQIKGGKFLSQFGRINGQHSHYWDFGSPPLVQSAFFGGGGLAELGLRLSWVAPLNIFLQFAVEILQGHNEMSFGHQGFDAGGISIATVDGPGLVVATVKSSFDLGNLTVLAGISSASGKSRWPADLENDNGASAFAGTAAVFGADITFKYLFDSIRYLSLQTEVMGRTSRGDRYGLEVVNGWSVCEQRSRQEGFYSQAVARLNKRLRFGARLDLIWKNDLSFAGMTQALPKNLMRYTAMGEWNPTEFSRLRLQYTYDRSRYEESGGIWRQRPVHELTLQVNITIGAHGAHAF
ncbi:MAG: hypothetical protein JXI33_04545 [Candidatus Aminicenantes bacterium]|nr:hypothetical protein [Candidatus Aminicenantes bacterium]